jgi:hypothetical protein
VTKEYRNSHSPDQNSESGKCQPGQNPENRTGIRSKKRIDKVQTAVVATAERYSTDHLSMSDQSCAMNTFTQPNMRPGRGPENKRGNSNNEAAKDKMAPCTAASGDKKTTKGNLQGAEGIQRNLHFQIL